MKDVHPILKWAGLGLIGAALVFGCAAWKAGSPSAAQRLADVTGARRFDQIEALRYTFNVKIADKVIHRAWTWEPPADRVTFAGTADQGGRIAYARADLASQPAQQLKNVDAWFINDNYWLLFPLRVAWDDTVTVTADDVPAALPIGSGKAERLIVRFPATGGYTPGDVYELFIDPAGRISQWIYRKGGAAQPTRTSTWEDYRTVGPLLLSLDRRGPDDSFRVWFTDVAVRVKGKAEWIAAN
jgi:hypothetical protein